MFIDSPRGLAPQSVIPLVDISQDEAAAAKQVYRACIEQGFMYGKRVLRPSAATAVRQSERLLRFELCAQSSSITITGIASSGRDMSCGPER